MIKCADFASSAVAVLCLIGGPVVASWACQNTAHAPAEADTPPPPLTAPALPIRQVIFTQIPVHVPAAGQSALLSLLPHGSRIMSLDVREAYESVVNLTPDFWSAGRPDVSFDGQRILFVGKRRSNDSFNVWEMNRDGSGLRQVTRQSGNCTAAIYLGTMFTIDAAQPEYQLAYCSAQPGEYPAIFTCKTDGSCSRQVTFNPYGVSDPYMLSDGRLLFSSYLAAESAGAVPHTVNTDGTDVFIFTGPDQPATWRRMFTETPDGWVVYVESSADQPLHGGRLVAVKRTSSLHTRRVLADKLSGDYHSPAALPDSRYLVSYRPTAGKSYGLYVLDPDGQPATQKIYDQSEWHELFARPVCPRPEPAGRSSVVDDRLASGVLYCMNAYLSNIDHTQGIQDQKIKGLRIVRALPGNGSGSLSEALLGVAQVEADGSFHVRVPARTPLRLQTLDADGKVLESMSSWMWVMPKESRGCIGCHEDRELSPPNRHPLALRRPAQPVGLVAQQSATGESE